MLSHPNHQKNWSPPPPAFALRKKLVGPIDRKKDRPDPVFTWGTISGTYPAYEHAKKRDTPGSQIFVELLISYTTGTARTGRRS